MRKVMIVSTLAKALRPFLPRRVFETAQPMGIAVRSRCIPGLAIR
jgi:hypothetical protein